MFLLKDDNYTCLRSDPESAYEQNEELKLKIDPNPPYFRKYSLNLIILLKFQNRRNIFNVIHFLLRSEDKHSVEKKNNKNQWKKTLELLENSNF